MEDIKTYVLSIFATALLITVVDILSPAGASSALSRYLKLVCALVFVCILISPTLSLAETLRDFANGELDFEIAGDVEDHYSEQLQGALDDASRQYFEGMLTQILCEEFEILEDDLRCHVKWVGEGENLHPEKVTVILSGKAIWKDPAKIEKFVSSLLNCDCVSAIE